MNNVNKSQSPKSNNSENMLDCIFRMNKRNESNLFNKIPKERYPKINTHLLKFQKYIKSFCLNIEYDLNYNTNYWGYQIFSNIEDVFYIMPEKKKIYCFYDDPSKEVDAKYIDKFIQSYIQCNENLDADKLYKLMTKLLTNISNIQPAGPLFNRYLHKVYSRYRTVFFTPFQTPYNHFIEVNNIICFIHSSIPQYVPADNVQSIKHLIPLTNKGFDSVTNILHYPEMSENLKKKYLSVLKKRKPFEEMELYIQPDTLFDSYGNYVKFENDRFVLQNADSQIWKHSILDHKLVCNSLHHPFICGEYSFSDKIIELLAAITGNSKKAFNFLAKLTAMTYLNGAPLKSATIIITNDSNYHKVKCFLQELLCDKFICNLNQNDYNNIERKYNLYMNASFSAGRAYIIELNKLPSNYEEIRKLLGATYFEVHDKVAGKIRFKNTAPIIVMAKDEKYAKEFSIRVNSNIIKPESNIPSIHNISRTHNTVTIHSSISTDEFDMLRQALSLYGLKLFSSTEKEDAIPLEHYHSDNEIVDEFIRKFCIEKADCFTSKSELRNSFGTYVCTYYKYSEIKPITICNKLRDLGHDIRHKKRINGSKNPVAVISGIEFNKDKFENSIKSIIPQSETKEESNEFSDILSELYAAKIDSPHDLQN